ncbi:phosphoribosyltransferase family protein [Pedobacter sp. P351]|uniref:ComF family protein n=1 Tax=Pedobacter superstes TaxID=3133441 RepID=UPI0030AD6AD2
MNVILKYAGDFLSLFFPQLCSGCGKSLFKNESVICINCVYHLPYTNFHLDNDNPVARQLWGRIPFNFAGAYLHFQKGSRVQNLMHELKYNNKPEVAFKLGEMYGRQLKSSADFQNPDVIIPVPLHPARQKKRGYNQSEYLAQGLAQSLNIPVKYILSRNVFTETQTRKSRFVRYENMKDVFVGSRNQDLENKHVLVVDDVVTTGATIEACAFELLKIKGLRVSVAAIAFTK